MKDFKKLVVWEKSMQLTRLVYDITKKLPDDERFGLISQMRRCAVSIPSNVAEGSKRKSDKDYAQFLSIAAGSAAELETQLILAQDMYDVLVDEVLQLLHEVQKMLEAFIRKL